MEQAWVEDLLAPQQGRVQRGQRGPRVRGDEHGDHNQTGERKGRIMNQQGNYGFAQLREADVVRGKKYGKLFMFVNVSNTVVMFGGASLKSKL